MHRIVVDVVAVAVRGGVLCVLVQDRRVPGGPVGAAEDLDAAARRVLGALCGPACAVWPLDQVGAYGGAAGAVRVAYRVLCPPTAGAGGGRWVPVADVAEPAVADAVDQLAHEIGLTTAAAALCPDRFTIPDLRQVYAAVWGQPLDAGNFHRVVRSDPAAWVATGGRRTGTGGRAAAVYRRGVHRLASPVLRPVDSSPGNTR